MAKQRQRHYAKPASDLGIAGASKQRPCLMCGTGFSSGWAGERVCPRCKTKAVWHTGTRMAWRPSRADK